MSETSVLATLGLSPAQAPELKSDDRNRLFNFLLRWEYYADLHACLDILARRGRPLASLLDLRVQALLGEGKPREALPVMQERLQVRDSLTAQALLAQVHLALADYAAAGRIVQAALQDNGDSVSGLELAGTVALASGDLPGAVEAYRRLQGLVPDTRAYLAGMMDIYQAQNDWVTATAYAVRVLRTAEEQERGLTVPQLRHLLRYFRASGDATRVADLLAELDRRHAEEIAAWQAQLADRASALPITPSEAAPSKTARAPRSAEPEFTPTFDQVPVSDDERTAVTEAVKRLFGFASFLPGQVETIACALRNEDALTILPTGGGKSLCYQVPAFLGTSGVTLVISPLIALMKDQVDSLPGALGGQATTINSALDNDELRQRVEQVAAGGYRLVYAAPERLRQMPFLHLLRRVGVNRLVIDEAHCVSVWGHDFRPDYLFIARARDILGRPPLLALTATAPPRVRRDIVQRLGGMRVIAGDVTRPNLHLSVFYARNNDDKLQRLLSFCKAQTGSGIVYAGTRERCEQLAELLRSQGVDAVHYHAGIANRAEVQDDFMGNRVRVVVATVAFGMGIDKPDIRFIVHFVPPPSLEAYYQEAGRAGRDGLPSHCLLMYATADRGVLTRRAHEDLMPVEFLRNVYGAVKRRLGGQTTGAVAAADLERDTQSDELRVRVALSLLEEAEMVRRGVDMPRSVLITQLVERDAPEDFARFCAVAHLRVRQPLTLSLVEPAQALGLTPEDLELRLLDWAEAGLMTYMPAGRDLCLTLLPPPADAAERVAALLERHRVIQEQRVDEITAYAQTGRCRHGYLNAYLGGRPLERCTACDNCVVDEVEDVATDLPDEAAQAQSILRILAASYGWGRANLASIMRGEPDTPPAAQAQPDFGALRFRSKSAIVALIARLEQEGFIRAETLDHGGVVVKITPKGRSAIEDRTLLAGFVAPPRPPAGPKHSKKRAQPLQVTLSGEDAIPAARDEALYTALRAWRLTLAQKQKVAAYVIFPDRTLDAIATDKPTSREALERIAGIGPKKLEQYGEVIVQLVQKHLVG